MIKNFERVKFKEIRSESTLSERKNVKENVEKFIMNLSTFSLTLFLSDNKLSLINFLNLTLSKLLIININENF